jgi:Domain of unknown function (DUF4349)
METPSDRRDLEMELRALRPSPQPAFAADLDARVTAGFQARSGKPPSRLGGVLSRLRPPSPRRALIPVGATALVAIAIATAVITLERGSDTASSPPVAAGTGERVASGQHARELPGNPPTKSGLSAGSSAPSRGAGGSGAIAGFQYSAAPPTAEPQPASGSGAPAVARREVERGAELVLRSKPGELPDDTRRVFATVHAARGIVLSSSVHDWKAGESNPSGGEARASFELLIPTARLSDTLASLSRIADVRSRHESTLDITAPTVGADERLDDAEARIDSLLAQLASAESEGERAAVGVELRGERQQAAALRSHLERLRQRAHFAHVSLRIESGKASGSSGGWAIDDAFGDAGRILETAAGVTVVSLAMIVPLALIALLAWLANRVWVRHRRERVLD